uniref:DUF4283 domain-containing protein n=1 Tax=Steinernema glaseri TaxID=37863 RepID=A0A1I7Y0R2_9BILA
MENSNEQVNEDSSNEQVEKHNPKSQQENNDTPEEEHEDEDAPEGFVIYVVDSDEERDEIHSFSPATLNHYVGDHLTLPDNIVPGEFLIKTTCIAVLLRPRSTRADILYTLFEIFDENPGTAAIDFVLGYLVHTKVFHMSPKYCYFTFQTDGDFFLTRDDFIMVRDVIQWKRSRDGKMAKIEKENEIYSKLTRTHIWY